MVNADAIIHNKVLSTQDDKQHAEAIPRCKKCRSDQTILLSKNVISLESAMRLIYGGKAEKKTATQYKCNKCGYIFED